MCVASYEYVTLLYCVLPVVVYCFDAPSVGHDFSQSLHILII